MLSMGKFDIKSMFSKKQIDVLFKLMRLNIPREEMELILKELEVIIQTKAVQRVDVFFEEIAENYKIDYKGEW